MVPLKSWPGIGLVLIVTFGLSMLTAVLSLGALPAVIGVVGWLIVAPSLAVLTYYDGRDEGTASEEPGDPIAVLRGRYARGELTEDEFERRLDQLLETEQVVQSSERERERTAVTER